MTSRGPVIVRIHNTNTSGGLNCCCCKCCTCLNLQFLKTQTGLYKLAEVNVAIAIANQTQSERLLTTQRLVARGIDAYISAEKHILGSFCQTLALEYGMAYAVNMGASFYGFLTASSWCVMTAMLLLFCYVISEKSYSLVRQSLLEVIFNVIAAFCYLSSTSYLGYIVNTILFPLFKSTAYFQAYPAMTGVYLIGTILGIIHAVDGYKAYKSYKGYG